MKKFIAFATVALSVSANAFAAGFTGVPTNWRLESYGQAAVVLWLTPATCGNGQLMLPGGATVTDHNRLYATVMAAKVANLSMFIYYEQQGNICTITSYGLG